MKIELKLTSNSLAHINEVIANNLPTMQRLTDKEAKAHYFQMQELAASLLKKAIDKRGTREAFTLKLKYYEAYALHKFLLLYIDYAETESRRITRDILGVINQKLT